MVHRVDDGRAVTMACDLCGTAASMDDSLPYVNQAASFATDHGCPSALPSAFRF